MIIITKTIKIGSFNTWAREEPNADTNRRRRTSPMFQYLGSRGAQHL